MAGGAGREEEEEKEERKKANKADWLKFGKRGPGKTVLGAVPGAGRGASPTGSPSWSLTECLQSIPWVSISHHAGQASIPAPPPSSTLDPGEHTGPGSMGPGVHAHLVPPEDRQRLSHGLPVGQDEVQHPVSVEVCHHTPCNNADFTLAIGQETRQGEGLPTMAASWCTCPRGGGRPRAQRWSRKPAGKPLSSAFPQPAHARKS